MRRSAPLEPNARLQKPDEVELRLIRQDVRVRVRPYRTVEGTPTRDLSIVRAGDPASLLVNPAASLENVQYNFSGSPTMPWRGFFFRLEVEPASTCEIAKIFPAGGQPGSLAYLASSNVLYHYCTGASFPTIAYTPGTWVWIEQILDVSTATRRLRTRVGGVDLTAIDEAVAASTVSHSGIGAMSTSDTFEARFSRSMWGTAASLTDWLGGPAAAGPLSVRRLVTPARW